MTGVQTCALPISKKSNWQLTALKDENIKNRYNIEVKNTYETLQDIGNDTAEQHWEKIERAIKRANEIVLPKKEKKVKKLWMTDSILELMDERRKYKDRNNERYKCLNKRIHKECNKAKEQWMNDKCTTIDILSKKDQQMMYEKVKELTCNKGYKTGKAIKTSEEKEIGRAHV